MTNTGVCYKQAKMRTLITLIVAFAICISCGTRKVFEVDTVTGSRLSGLYSDTTDHLATPVPNADLRIFFGTVNKVRKIGLGMDTVTNDNGSIRILRPKRPIIMDRAGWIIASKNGFMNDTVQFDYSELKNTRLIINLERRK